MSDLSLFPTDQGGSGIEHLPHIGHHRLMVDAWRREEQIPQRLGSVEHITAEGMLQLGPEWNCPRGVSGPKGSPPDHDDAVVERDLRRLQAEDLRFPPVRR